MRIGYLTDIHLCHAVPGSSPIAKRRSREMVQLVPRCLDRLRALDVDLVLCSGDLIDDPEHPFAAADLALVGNMFAQSGLPFVLIPGNHDPQPEVFYRILPRPERSRQADGCELVVFCDDACAPGEQASTRSAGEMQALRNVCLADPPVEGIAVIAQHYVIHPDYSSGYPHNYCNDVAIQDVMAQSNRSILSISGHYHPGIALTEHRGVRYFAGRAFCEPPHSYYVIDVRDGTLVIHEAQLEGKD
jgi:hypothetical protein